MFNWDSVQERYVDPVSTNDIKIDTILFNKSFLNLVKEEFGIINGLEITRQSNKLVNVNKGICVCDSVFIRFLDNIVIDITNSFFYKTTRHGLINSAGTYPIVVDYKYSRNIVNKPIAKIVILKNPEVEFDKTRQFPIGNIITDINGNILEVTNKNPINSKLNRKIIEINEYVMTESIKPNTIVLIDGGVL